ncbi:MAG: MerR family DNA-binding protein [Micromonosporaceae bacterium]
MNRQTCATTNAAGSSPEPARGPGGHRRYPPEALIRLRAIRAAQRLGFTLDEIAAMLADPARPSDTVQARARAKLAGTDRRIAEPAAARSAPAQVVNSGCESLTECTCPDAVREFVGAPRRS